MTYTPGASPVEDRALRLYQESASAYIRAVKDKENLVRTIAEYTETLKAVVDEIKDAEKEMHTVTSILFGNGGIKDKSFAELFRRFELINGEGADKTAKLFGYTSSATLFWKQGTGLPKQNTWETVAAIIEERTAGLIKKDDVLTLLKNDRDSRNASAESDTASAPVTKEDDANLFSEDQNEQEYQTVKEDAEADEDTAEDIPIDNDEGEPMKTEEAVRADTDENEDETDVEDNTESDNEEKWPF